MTQVELARKAHLQQRTISALELGKSAEPRPSTLRKLANALDIDVDVLVGEPLPKDDAAQARPDRPDEVEVPEDLATLLRQRLGVLFPVSILDAEDLVDLVEKAEDREALTSHLVEASQAERIAVLEVADEAERRARDGAYLAPESARRLDEFKAATQRTVLVARELTLRSSGSSGRIAKVEA